MNQAIAEGIFPGAVVLVSKENAVFSHEAYGYANLNTRKPMTRETVFDLASLTKPLATTLAVMKAVGEGRLSLNQRLGSILTGFKGTDKDPMTIRQLLCHNSGLVDHRPYYLELVKLPLQERPAALRNALTSAPTAHPTGDRTVYSDLGFMILRWVAETVFASRMDRIVGDTIYRPLGIPGLRFRDRGSSPQDHEVPLAATENCPWRGFLLEGEVHDENAWAVGGIEGHAGLFGTADDVNRLLWKLLAVYYGGASLLCFTRELLQRFFRRQKDAGRPLGFDSPSPTGASCGRLFSRNAIGHLGFTGTSFWVDLDRSVVAILLTNRVHPTRDNIRIRSFRPVFHDTVMETLGGA